MLQIQPRDSEHDLAVPIQNELFVRVGVGGQEDQRRRQVAQHRVDVVELARDHVRREVEAGVLPLGRVAAADVDAQHRVPREQLQVRLQVPAQVLRRLEQALHAGAVPHALRPLIHRHPEQPRHAVVVGAVGEQRPQEGVQGDDGGGAGVERVEVAGGVDAGRGVVDGELDPGVHARVVLLVVVLDNVLVV